MITQITNLDELNSLLYTRLINPHPLKLDFDLRAAFVINNSLYSNLRSSLLNGSTYEQFIDSTTFTSAEDLPSLLSTCELYGWSNTSPSNTIFFYPYSSKNFYSDFYSDLTPSLYSSVMSLLKSTGRISQIGTGYGKAFIIKPQLMGDIHFQSLPTPVDPNNIIQSIQTISNSLSSYVEDTNYLLSIIEQKDQTIQYLQNQIDLLNKKINSVYQTTWR